MFLYKRENLLDCFLFDIFFEDFKDFCIEMH